MKKKPHRLSLNRETLLGMNPENIVAGIPPLTQWRCSGSCEYSCQADCSFGFCNSNNCPTG